MGKTLLVETLVEQQESQLLAGASSVFLRADIDERLADCEQVLTYLQERFVEQHHVYSRRFCRVSTLNTEGTPSELADMDDAALLKYGSVLKYILCAEASLQDVPLDVCRAKLREAQIEWRRRFGESVIADSI
jgi:hypothetical protein